MLFEFDVNNEDYLWLSILYKDNTIEISKHTLDLIVQKYNLDPKKFKKKRLLIQDILFKWEKYFKDHPDFLSLYQEIHGCKIEEYLIINDDENDDEYEMITI